MVLPAKPAAFSDQILVLPGVIAKPAIPAVIPAATVPATRAAAKPATTAHKIAALTTPLSA